MFAYVHSGANIGCRVHSSSHSGATRCRRVLSSLRRFTLTYKCVNRFIRVRVCSVGPARCLRVH